MSKKSKTAKSSKPSKVEAKLPETPVVVTPVEKVQVVKVAEARHAAPATRLVWKQTTNPKRPGTAAHARAAGYWNAPTVGEYIAKGGERIDLAWDADHGFLSLSA